MAVYRQILSWYEDGYGSASAIFVVSDSYAALFDLATAIDVDIFRVKTTKHDLDLGQGILADDEMDLEIDADACETTDDSDALAFVLDAQSSNVDRTKIRFVALFLEAADEALPTTAEMEFSGCIRPEMQADDKLWHGGDWNSLPDPVRVWKLKADPMMSASFDALSMEDMIYGHGDIADPIVTSYVKGITAAFEASDVADRPGYFDVSAAARCVKWGALVSLNELIRHLCDNAIATLDARGQGTFTINLPDSPIDFIISPARFRWSEVGAQVSRYCQSYRDPSPAPYVVKADDAVSAKLGDVAPNYYISISYNLVKPAWSMNQAGGTEKDYGFEKFKSFTEFLYAVALHFGVYLMIEHLSAEEFNIRFVSRTAILKDTVFVRDVTNASVDIKPTPIDTKRFYGMALSLAAEGQNDYTNNWDGLGYYPSQKTRDLEKSISQKGNGERTLFSISPTLRTVYSAKDVISYATGYARYPHNSRFYDSGVLKALGDPRYDAEGITTALYVQTVGNGEYNLTSSNGLYLPGAAIHANIDGVDETYFSLSDYLNRIYGRDGEYYETEYTLSAPFICSFRRSADGTSIHDNSGRGRWQNLERGSKLTLDGMEYVVVGIERDYDGIQTKIRLHNRSRFAFSEATAAAEELTPSESPEPLVLPGADSVYRVGAADGDVQGGDLVAATGDGLFAKALATNGHFNVVCGVAMHDASDGEMLSVQSPGSVISSTRYTLTPGMRVFLRTGSGTTENISATFLTGHAGGENYFLPVGTAITEDSFAFEIGTGFIFPPMII